jgi:hypothetical protein
MSGNYYKIFISVCLFTLACCLSCSPDEEIITCQRVPVWDDELDATYGDPVAISHAEILSNCIEIRFNYAGCTENASFHLAIMEADNDVFPPERDVRLALAQDGDCAITHHGTLRVNLTSLQMAGSERVLLNLSGWAGQLEYGY